MYNTLELGKKEKMPENKVFPVNKIFFGNAGKFASVTCLKHILQLSREVERNKSLFLSSALTIGGGQTQEIFMARETKKNKKVFPFFLIFHQEISDTLINREVPTRQNGYGKIL